MKILSRHRVGSLAYPGEIVELTQVDFSDYDANDKIRVLRQMINMGATDPLVNQLAHSLVAHVPPRHTLAQAAVLLRFVQDNVTYVDDGVQTFRTAPYTLLHPTGNCASAGAILFGSLCETITIPVKLEVLEKKLGLFRRDPFHVYCLVGAPARNPQFWIPAEATQKVPLGWSPSEYAEQHADEL